MKIFFLRSLILLLPFFLCAMDDCITSKFFKLQQDTWPLRRQLEHIKKFFARTKPILTTELHEKFKWHQQSIEASLDAVIIQYDHARMDMSTSKFSKMDEYYEKAETHLAQAAAGLNDYKLSIKNTLKIDFDTKAAL